MIHNKKIICISSALMLALFTGCSFKVEKLEEDKVDMSNYIKKEDVKVEKICKIPKLKRSLEQGIKDQAYKMGFIAKINNLTDENPSFPGISNFYKLNENLKDIKVLIENFGDDSRVKQVFISDTFEKNTLKKELDSIDYTFQSNFISGGDLVRVFSMSDILLNMPKHLTSKAIKVVPEQKYSLYSLLNKLSLKLNSTGIYTNLYMLDSERLVEVVQNPLLIEGSKETLKEIAIELKKYNIPFSKKHQIELYGNYTQQDFAKKIASKKKKYEQNRYSICIGSDKNTYVLKDNNIKVVNDNFSLKITKIRENS